jgi:hypothetical protein
MDTGRTKRMRPTLGRSGVLLAASAMLAWIVVSDDWSAIANDGNATTAINIGIGLLITAGLLTMIGLTLAATRRRDG